MDGSPGRLASRAQEDAGGGEDAQALGGGAVEFPDSAGGDDGGADREPVGRAFGDEPRGRPGGGAGGPAGRCADGLEQRRLGIPAGGAVLAGPAFFVRAGRGNCPAITTSARASRARLTIASARPLASRRTCSTRTLPRLDTSDMARSYSGRRSGLLTRYCPPSLADEQFAVAAEQQLVHAVAPGGLQAGDDGAVLGDVVGGGAQEDARLQHRLALGVQQHHARGGRPGVASGAAVGGQDVGRLRAHVQVGDWVWPWGSTYRIRLQLSHWRISSRLSRAL